MNSIEITRRLRAFERGVPLPRGSTIHVPIATGDNLLTLAFVRMGGESGPWAVAWRRGRGAMKMLSAPEPRNREMVGDMALALAPVLLGHLDAPDFGKPEKAMGEDAPLRQIWVPNGTHIDMLHILGFVYSFTRFGTEERQKGLRALGRACGWLFRESQRPGQVLVVDACKALRESFAFPAENSRQSHLGYLMAWLQGPKAREARIRAATEAERLTISTSLDPSYERDVLQPLVEEYNDARHAEREREQSKLAARIEAALRPELERRLMLTEEAIQTLRSDKRPLNEGVAELVEASQEEHRREYLGPELRARSDGVEPRVASPATDRHPAAAAARYFTHQASADRFVHCLLHHDRELQAEAVAAGTAIQGTIAEVRDDGSGRKQIPVWVIRDASERPLWLRVGDRVCVAGLPKRWGILRSVDTDRRKGRRYEVEINGLKTTPRDGNVSNVVPATARSLVGSPVVLLKTSGEDLLHRKRDRSWNKDGPGEWLMGRQPPSVTEPAPNQDGAQE